MAYTKLYKPCVGHKHKYIWYLVPKAGSRSLLYWLTQQGLLDQRLDKQPNFDLFTELQAGYFTFAFCRNPYDRLVSVYFDKVKKQQLPLYRRWKDKSFQQFASDICDMPTRKMDGHLLPQIYFIPEYIDFLGRFENLKNDFHVITNQLFPITFDNRKYNSTQHKHYSEYYNKALKDKVYTKYKEDFERFNYDAE